MNIRDLITKLDTISEADAPAAAPAAAPVDPARAQYDKFKADDAKAAAVAQVKQMTKPSGMSNFIDPKDGIIKWQEQGGEGGGAGGIREFPFDWYKKGQQKEWFDILKAAGLEVVPVEKKQLFGTTQVAGIKGGPQALADLGKAPAATAATPAATPATKPGAANDDAQKLEALVAQLEQSLGGSAGSPAGTTAPADAAPVTLNKPLQKPEKTLGQKAGIGAGIGAGALAGGALGKKYGGKVGAGLGALAGGALGGMGVNAFQNEGFELNEDNSVTLTRNDGSQVRFNPYTLEVLEDSSIAGQLMESFGHAQYMSETELAEYSWNQFKSDAGDTARGFAQGATLGTYDNIAAGVKSALGPGTYKDELAKQTAASKEAEKRSPWLYGAGNVAGSIAAPVPGGAIAAGVGKLGGGALARGAAALGANMAAQYGIDKLKAKSDTKTLGYDPNKYPTTTQEIAAFQKANGLTADGVIGPKTKAVLAKMGLAPEAAPQQAPAPSVAESIRSLQDRLAQIEEGVEETEYTFYLLEDGTVVCETGDVITDEQVLSEINWGGMAKGAWNAVKGGAGKAWDAAKNLGKGIKSPNVTPLPNVGKATNVKFKGPSTAFKAGQVIGRNPGKAALGAAGLGAAGTLAALGGAGASPEGTTDTAPIGSSGSGGGDASAAPETGDTSAAPTTGDTSAAPTTTPTAAGKLTPEQQALIKQIQSLMAGHDENDASPEWTKATSHAQAVIGKAEGGNKDQIAADQKKADDAAKPAADATKPATGGQASAPAGTTMPTQTLTIPKVPAGTTVGKDGVTEPATGITAKAAETPKIQAPTADNKPQKDGVTVWKESEDAELARWLKIARG